MPRPYCKPSALSHACKPAKQMGLPFLAKSGGKKERRTGDEGVINFYNFLLSPKGPNASHNIPFCFIFQVVVKTVSGSVASWPATGNVTTRPLPVLENIQTVIDEDTKEAAVVWEPHPDSLQDEYKVGHQYIF